MKINKIIKLDNCYCASVDKQVYFIEDNIGYDKDYRKIIFKEGVSFDFSHSEYILNISLKDFKKIVKEIK